MRPHERLDAWNLAMDFVVDVYRVTDTFPKEEKFGLTSQIRRAAVSVPANIAEGAARKSDQEFVHLLSNAQGSASELETEIILAHRLKYVSNDDFSRLKRDLEHIGRFIYGLSQHVGRRVH